jgi:hypothetical protein
MEKNALTRKVLLAPLADDGLTAAREEARTEKSPKESADRRREEEGSGKEGTEGSLRIFSDLLSSLREAVIITDARGRLEHMNRKAQSLTGWSLPEAENRPLPEVFHMALDEKVWVKKASGEVSIFPCVHRQMTTRRTHQMPYELITRLLGFPDFRLVDIDTKERSVVLTLEREKKSFRCGSCGKEGLSGYDHTMQEVRHLLWWQHPTVIRFPRYRVSCPRCGRVTEAVIVKQSVAHFLTFDYWKSAPSLSALSED